jgi:hypothetical protein
MLFSRTLTHNPRTSSCLTMRKATNIALLCVNHDVQHLKVVPQPLMLNRLSGIFTAFINQYLSIPLLSTRTSTLPNTYTPIPKPQSHRIIPIIVPSLFLACLKLWISVIPFGACRRIGFGMQFFSSGLGGKTVKS